MVGQNFKTMDDLLKCSLKQLEGESIDEIIHHCVCVSFFKIT